jgi:BirA family biotin operon repressor/biotin-[acetyl-CoA-carboxylase] ligase
MPAHPSHATLDVPWITAQFTGGRVGLPLHYTAQLASTMDAARELADRDAPGGTLVATEEQTAGRGRRGRVWHAPATTALLVSVVLRPPQLQLPATHVPMLAAIALIEAVAELTPAFDTVLSLKWPNDLVIGRDPATAAKLAGILVESRLTPTGRLDFAVVGIGVNANQRDDELPPVPAPFPRPTSLALQVGRPVDRSRLLVLLCRRLDARLDAPAEQIRLAWRRRLGTLGQSVALYPHGVESAPLLTGTAVGVDDYGSLIVADAAGRRHIFNAGDVSLRAAP